MGSFQPTTEQAVAVHKASNMSADETLLITAFAGAAKTTTLELIAQSLPQRRFLYLAFNKAIVEEAKKRFPKNVTIKTTHSLAYQYTAVDKKLRHSNYRAAEIAEMFHIEYKVAEHVLSVFDFFCNSAVESFGQIAVDTSITDLAESLYTGMREGRHEITHSYYLKEFQLKLVSGLKVRQNFDYCLLDEAQDTNPVTLSIFNHLSGKKIKVGDRHQAIYGFRGAINAMGGNNPKAVPGTIRMNLTTTFRCKPHIVDHANWILETLKGEQAKIVSGNKTQANITTQACITRTNSAMIEFIDDLDNFNLTRSPDLIFDCLMSLLNWKYGLVSNISKPFKFLTMFNSMGAINEYVELTDDQELKQGLKLLEKYDNETWADSGFRNGDKIRQLYQKACDNHLRNGQSLTTLTTAHSAKGLEFDKVVLGEDFPDMVQVMAKLIQKNIIAKPEDFLKGQKQELVSAREEANLYYVAVTRAKYELQDNTPNASLYETKMPLERIFALARQTV